MNDISVDNVHFPLPELQQLTYKLCDREPFPQPALHQMTYTKLICNAGGLHKLSVITFGAKHLVISKLVV